ncbi:MAG TPA: tyrosine--tRNA ligase [Roseiflexaceae bacterium]|nr:tyrosine--tRNA ligase [Roseiflexaceae bacterium]HMP40441.1 tyrosine--tRNA ligase [Roseiflexaceae bacterium]
MSGIIEELTWRGLLQDSTEGIAALAAREPVTLYNGFDPTADSLHVGHLVPLLALARWQRLGHTPIALAGGGTGMIGDPSGRSSERQLLTRDQVDANVDAIKQQLARFLDFNARSNPAQLVNNADWLTSLSAIGFLRDVGKHLTVNYMIAKDSVRSRLSNEHGISFTEFSYMLLQAYDFQYLYEHHGCRVQTGGSDQWGNITAGTELIRRAVGGQAHGVVYPLITRADGSKFGKTAEGSVWLDANRTSPYRFYQFWLNTDDSDAINYLRYFTWLTRSEIEEYEQQLYSQPEQRAAQIRLAREVTGMVHGETALARAEQASQALFGGALGALGAADIADIFADVPSSSVPQTALGGEGMPLIDLLTTTGAAASRGEARRLIEGGGVYINNLQAADVRRMVTLADSVEGQFIILRKGRKQYFLVRIEE